MAIKCVWEHNGTDSLLYAVDLPGAYARGVGREEALQKMRQELPQFLRWMGRELPPEELAPVIIQEKTSTLRIADADSDVLFESERLALTPEEYAAQKALALRSAADFLALYRSIPDPDQSALPPRETFYGAVPRTAREMYEHTKNVNAYYFREIGIAADNEGDILSCRERGFLLLERQLDYLKNEAVTRRNGHCARCCGGLSGTTVSMPRRWHAWRQRPSAQGTLPIPSSLVLDRIIETDGIQRRR